MPTALRSVSSQSLNRPWWFKRRKKKAKRFANRSAFVFKTDIASFYASINHRLMQQQFNQVIEDQRVRRLIWDSMERLHVCDGVYRHVTKKGISRGCSLSPLMGALYLTPLDDYAKANQLSVLRFTASSGL